MLVKAYEQSIVHSISHKSKQNKYRLRHDEKVENYLDPRFQALAVLGLESLFDISQIDLGSRDDNSDESFVVGA